MLPEYEKKLTVGEVWHNGNLCCLLRHPRLIKQDAFTRASKQANEVTTDSKMCFLFSTLSFTDSRGGHGSVSGLPWKVFLCDFCDVLWSFGRGWTCSSVAPPLCSVSCRASWHPSRSHASRCRSQSPPQSASRHFLSLSGLALRSGVQDSADVPRGGWSSTPVALYSRAA